MRFLRIDEVRKRVPFGRATIYRMIAAGEFPKPYALGARAVAWLEDDIENWIKVRVNAQDTSRADSAAARLVAR